MEKILNYNNKSLVKKYDKYYIRFIGGQYVELPCDILITDNEASKIIENNSFMDEIFKMYKSKIPWTVEAFIKRGLMDYMIYNGKYTQREADEIIDLLVNEEDIKYEMYETAMTGEYPTCSPVKVNGFTANIIEKERNISSCRAYVELLKLRINI